MDNSSRFPQGLSVEESIDSSATVMFKSLDIRYEEAEEQYIIGDVLLNEFIEVPPVALRAMQELNAGKSIEQVEAELSAAQGEHIGVLEFVHVCCSLGFVSTVNGQLLVPPQIAATKMHFEFISPGIASFLFSRQAWWVYCTLFLGFLVLCYHDHDISPRLSDFVWNRSYTVSFWGGMVVAWAIIGFHEIGHLLAARKMNLSGRIGFGHEGAMLDIQTDIPGIWRANKRQRAEIYMGGLAFSAVLGFASALVVYLQHHHVLHVSQPVLGLHRYIVLNTLWVFGTQVLIFSHTDLYHLLADAIGSPDLIEKAFARVKQRLSLNLTAEDVQHLAYITEEECRVVTLAAPLYFLHIAFNVIYSVLYTAVVIYFAKLFFGQFAAHDFGIWSWQGIDRIVGLLWFGVLPGWQLYYWMQNASRKTRPVLQESSIEVAG